uniref:Uncharacterized protein n=1 Tax=Arundo donax TaxID=35708 RepID=A0A0A9G7R4_ARUDO
MKHLDLEFSGCA